MPNYSREMGEYECKCPCHDLSPGTNFSHPPCCFTCPNCGRRIILGALGVRQAHLKKCQPGDVHSRSSDMDFLEGLGPECAR